MGAGPRTMSGAPPKVFISYSHDTVSQQERVLDLADRLRTDGIDAEIDQYTLFRGGQTVAAVRGASGGLAALVRVADRDCRFCADGLHRDLSPPGQG